MCSCLRCFSVVAFTLQDEQSPPSPRGLLEMNRQVCFYYIFSSLALLHCTLPSTAAIKRTQFIPTTFDRVWNVQMSGLTWSRMQGKAQPLGPKPNGYLSHSCLRQTSASLSAVVQWTKHGIWVRGHSIWASSHRPKNKSKLSGNHGSVFKDYGLESRSEEFY